MSETLNFGNKNLAGVASLTAATFTTGTTAPMQFTGTGSLVSINAGTSGLTETLTVSGNTSFVGNVTVTSDASSNNYVLARRVPAGSLDVTQYVTGSVPLTTTTNLIQNYLSNAAQITSNTGTGSITQALYLPGTANSGVIWQSGGHSIASSNLALSNLFVEAWVNRSATSAQNMIIIQRGTPATGTDFNFFLAQSTSLLSFTVSNATTSITSSNSTALNAGTWYHVAGSYTRTGLNTGTVRCFVNGGLGGTTASFTVGTQPLFTPSANVVIGRNTSGEGLFFGNVADVRVFSGSLIVPTATFTTNTAPFTQSAPSYVTNMGLVGTANTVLALQSQYFPGASTSPYGPCLTLPGTVGSYYAQSGLTHSDWKGSGGFTLEAWVNYASFASANALVTGASQMYTIVAGQPTSTGNTWTFGATTAGSLAFGWRTSTATASMNAFVTSNTLTTGSWNHVLVQSNASNVYMAINGNFTTLTAQGFTPTNASGTVAPTIAPSTSNTATSELSYPVTVGQFNSLTGPNVSVAKARLIYGANVYSSGSFTPNPNFAASATAPFWNLETQYPLPTYPSFFDVPVLPQQTPAYGAEPVVVGGVTSNVLSPYSTTYPQLDSIRFDGTGYIDYGNAASSSLTTNIWASNWTIEAWVYPTVAAGNVFARSNLATGVDLSLSLSGGTVNFSWGSSSLVGPAISLNQWTHIAATYDGTRANVYAGGTGTSTGTLGSLPFTPSYNTQIGGPTLFTGNLADVRVSNVARYTGSTYTVPSSPFATDSNTLLLLKSLGGQVGTTLEVQGRGLNAVSLGATRSVQSYPPAPMSSYLLDTTSNALVTYGQGKYVASASGEFLAASVYKAFDKNTATNWEVQGWSSSAPYGPTSSVTTVDALGNSYAGDWIQIQMPLSIILSSYQMQGSFYASTQSPAKWFILGSRDGINWNLVDSRTGITNGTSTGTYTVSSTQAYTYYRMVINLLQGGGLWGQVTEWTLNGTEESLCVTNDSKVGVGIANPQRALEVAGDLVVSGTISGGAGMGSFRNRIINGDFRIAQRGTSNAVPTTGAYMLDRFIVNSSVTATQTQQALAASDAPYQIGFRNSLKTTINSGVNFATAGTGYLYPCQQLIEGYNIQDLNWGTSFGSPVTLSFWVRSNIPSGSTSSVTVYNNLHGSSIGYAIRLLFTYYTTATWQYVTLTCPPPPNGSTWGTGTSTGIAINLSAVNYNQPGNTINSNPNVWESTTTFNRQGLYNDYLIAQTAGNYIEFTGVQLEKGTVATPFEFRPYATELALCQRYYTRFDCTGATSNYTRFGAGVCDSAASAYTILQLPVPMRTTPAYPGNATSNSAPSTFSLTIGGSSFTVTSMSASDRTPVSVGTTWTGTGGVARAGALALANNTTAAFLAYDAEL